MLLKTEARKRVEEELEQRGMLLVEGSNDFPSVAGLQADNPGKVGGFSWDSAPAHALAHVLRLAPTLPHDHLLVMNMCGRGDKDVFTVADALGVKL